MSYSRWSNSRWYTFWSGDAKTKEDEVFEICELIRPSSRFTYKEIKQDIQAVLQKVRDTYSLSGKTKIGGVFYVDAELMEYEGISLSDADINELKEYMEQFLSDIDEHYATG